MTAGPVPFRSGRVFSRSILGLALVWGMPATPGRAADGPDVPAWVEFAQDFRGKRFDIRTMKIDGANAEQLVRPEDAGLRITIPAGTGKPGPVGVATQFGVRGDFEITAGYQILKAAEPTEGYGVGVSVFVQADTPTRDEITAEWSILPKEGERQTSTWITDDANGKRQFKPARRPSKSRTGRVRIVRKGGDVEVAFSEGIETSFTTLRTVPFGTADLKSVRLTANTGWSGSPVDLRLIDLKVRAESLPGYSQPLPTPAKPSTLWAVAAGVAVLVALGGGVWWKASRSRQAVAPAGDDWGDGELARLERIVSAFARDHPEAEALVVPPLFQFSLHDGKIHGPFLIFERLDREKAKAVGSSWKEIRERVTRRYEGAYRAGLREGAFVFRDGSGDSVTRRYQDGEPAG